MALFLAGPNNSRAAPIRGSHRVGFQERDGLVNRQIEAAAPPNSTERR